MIKGPLILNFISKMIILDTQRMFLTPYLANEKNAQIIFLEKIHFKVMVTHIYWTVIFLSQGQSKLTHYRVLQQTSGIKEDKAIYTYLCIIKLMHRERNTHNTRTEIHILERMLRIPKGNWIFRAASGVFLLLSFSRSVMTGPEGDDTSAMMQQADLSSVKSWNHEGISCR